MKKISTLTLGLLAAAGAYAGSFQLPTQGVRQSAMGGSGVAFPWDISTIFFNPGGLGRLKGMQVSGQLYILNPSVRYAAPGTGNYFADNKRELSTPFAFYAGGKLRQDDRIAFGVGIYTPFGSNLNWGEDWRGRYVVQDISLQSIYFQPTVSYEISDAISIGAGFVYGIGNVEIHKALPVQDASGEGQASLKGNADGFGFNAGIQIRPTDNLHFGISYRSGVVMKVDDGNADFKVPASLRGNFPATRFSTKLNLPDIITLGVAGKVSRVLTLQGDIIYATWDKYESLAFDFENNTASLQDTDEPREYNNTIAVRLGANIKVTEELDLMVGFNYDPTPTKDNLLSPDAVDGNRLGFSGGLVYAPTSRINLAAQVSYVNVAARDASYDPANFAGTYQIKSLSPAISLTYKFHD